MNSIFLKKSILLSLLVPLTLASSLTLAAGFATFNSNNKTNFDFTSDANKATFSIDRAIVDFQFTKNVIGLPSSFYADQDAYLTMNGTTKTKADNDGNGELTQDIDQTWTMSFTSKATGKNLLSIVVEDYQKNKPSTFFGGENTEGVVLTAADPRQNITFSSDFLTFNPNSKDSLSIGFTVDYKETGNNDNEGLVIDKNGFLSSFTASELGTFSSTPVPTMSSVPEPEAYAMLLSGLSLIGSMSGQWRRRCNKRHLASPMLPTDTNLSK